MAINNPRVRVRARKVEKDAQKPHEAIAPLFHKLADGLRINAEQVEVELLDALPPHVGLGSHTQLALALGTAMCRACELDHDIAAIAKAAGRGGTSGIGVNAFRNGGLVVDGGHSFGDGAEKETCLPSSASRARVAPLLARHELPEQWRFALVTPHTDQGANGAEEVSLFGEAFPLPAAETGEVCRRVLLGLMPGAARGDIELLGQSIQALQRIGFKRREVALQPPVVQELLDVMVRGGAAGAGLSSFGPTVYAIAAHQEAASKALDAALEHLNNEKIDAHGWIAAPDNTGAIITAG